MKLVSHDRHKVEEAHVRQATVNDVLHALHPLPVK